LLTQGYQGTALVLRWGIDGNNDQTGEPAQRLLGGARQVEGASGFIGILGAPVSQGLQGQHFGKGFVSKNEAAARFIGPAGGLGHNAIGGGSIEGQCHGAHAGINGFLAFVLERVIEAQSGERVLRAGVDQGSEVTFGLGILAFPDKAIDGWNIGGRIGADG
jgi:hypothetical protein